MKFRFYFINMLVAGVCLVMTLSSCLAAVKEEEIKKMQKAMPAKARVAPKKPGKLLVFSLCKGYKHSSIPYCNKALQIMGEKTGAFEVTISEDMDVFKPEKLKKFDAVCFNNTTKLGFEDPNLRKSLMDFVKGGKGIIGIHAATDNFYKWPEAARMMGGLFKGHPWTAGGTWMVKVDDPDHVLNKAFEEKRFRINDEIYLLKQLDLYQNCRVLLSIDYSDLRTKTVYKKATENPISWVRRYGKGRVFYCSLGHNHHIFWNETVLRHYLDGIQFAMGDLKCDTTPTAVLKKEKPADK